MAYWINYTVDSRLSPLFHWLDKPDPRPDDQTIYGAPLDLERLPTRAKQQSKHKNIPDYFAIMGLTIVSERVHSLIEELEPDVHQFVPIELMRRDGNLFGTQHYIFQNISVLDALNVEQSNVSWMKNDWGQVLVQAAGGAHWVVDKAAVSGHHVWREKKKITDIFWSDSLIERYRTQRMTGLQMEKAEEI